MTTRTGRDRLSQRARGIAPAATLAISAAAKQLVAAGEDVVDFGVGEPDFPTPDFVRRAGIAAIEAGRTRYTDAAGTAALRDAIVEKFRREHDAGIERANVVATAGAKQALFNACQVLFDDGDEVALFSPYWVSYPEMIALAGAHPLFVPTDPADGRHPRAARLREFASEKTRGVIVNSPNNPTGAVIAREELEEILEWAEEAGAYVLFDECYEKFLYEGREHVSAARYWDAHGDRIIVAGAASKTYAMTGWRLGWGIGPRDVIGAMANYQSHATSNPSSVSQEAALAALTEISRARAAVDEMLREYERRRNRVVEGLGRIAGVRVTPPEGAFYAFVDVSALFPKAGVKRSGEFARLLLEKARVAAVPGSAFGDDHCIRLSFATSIERIEEGIARILRFSEEFG